MVWCCTSAAAMELLVTNVLKLMLSACTVRAPAAKSAAATNRYLLILRTPSGGISAKFLYRSLTTERHVDRTEARTSPPVFNRRLSGKWALCMPILAFCGFSYGIRELCGQQRLSQNRR